MVQSQASSDRRGVRASVTTAGRSAFQLHPAQRRGVHGRPDPHHHSRAGRDHHPAHRLGGARSCSAVPHVDRYHSDAERVALDADHRRREADGSSPSAGIIPVPQPDARNAAAMHNPTATIPARRAPGGIRRASRAPR